MDCKYYQLAIVKCQLSIVLFVALSFTLPVRAQVTIGNQVPPHAFSLLELLTNQTEGGLRLPQLSTDDREKYLTPLLNAQTDNSAKGLIIYNLTMGCLEFWNGSKWISLCSNATADCNTFAFPYIGSAYTLCTGMKISDLTDAAGGYVLWYGTSGGATPLDGATPLTNGGIYYAEQNLYGCKSARFPVTVTLGDCNTAPAGSAVTTFVNVMYDFQHQTLEAYGTGGVPTDYRWQVSNATSNDGDFKDIDGAPNTKFFTIPAHFADARGDSLFFRCKLSNSAGTVPASGLSNLNILFIKTNTSGYGIDPATGVRYLTIQKGGSPNIKIALLNLGAGESDYTGCMGDIYQWGRMTDGHEHIVWTKDAYHNNAFGTGTSALAANPGTLTYTPEGQIPATATDYYGHFIAGGAGDWSDNASNHWGDGTDNRPASEITWTYPKNNPCPTGWIVPSRWNLWDIYKGDGANAIPNSVSNYPSTVNSWSWRAASTTYAMGGIIITNAAKERVFLPAIGYRDMMSGLLGVNSFTYWSSTYTSLSLINAYQLYANNAAVTLFNPTNRSYGFPVRCIKE